MAQKHTKNKFFGAMENKMRKFNILLTCVMLGFSSPSNADSLHNAEIEQIISEASSFNIDNIAEDKRKAVIQAVSKKLESLNREDKNYATKVKKCEIILVRMGHMPAIQRLGKKFKSLDKEDYWNSIFTIRAAESLSLIPQLAEELFNEEEFGYVGINYDIRVMKKSFQSAEIIRDLLASSPKVDSKVKSWAKKEKLYGDPVLLRSMMRQWWLENKVVFDTGTYSEIRPGN